MIRYAAGRLLLAIPTLLAVALLIFAGVRLAPGDPALTIAGEQATQETVEAIRHQLGLDQPFLVQLGRYLMGLARLDLGQSIFSRAPVVHEIAPRLPTTLAVAATSTALASALGLLLGVVAAVHHRRLLDYASMTFGLLGLSVPNFALALLLMLVFAVKLRVLPATGSGSLLHYVMPTITLGLSAAAVVARMTRGSLLEVLRQDYVRTARAKGLPERVVVYRHALKNALMPVVTIVGLQFGQLIGGAVIVESVFGLPGIGKLLIDRILSRDYPVVQGTVLFAAFSFVLVNLVVDLLYGILDPRVRYS